MLNQRQHDHLWSQMPLLACCTGFPFLNSLIIHYFRFTDNVFHCASVRYKQKHVLNIIFMIPAILWHLFKTFISLLFQYKIQTISKCLHAIQSRIFVSDSFHKNHYHFLGLYLYSQVFLRLHHLHEDLAKKSLKNGTFTVYTVKHTNNTHRTPSLVPPQRQPQRFTYLQASFPPRVRL